MPRITLKERRVLIDDIAQHTIEQRYKLKEAKNWNQLRRYVGLIGLMGIVSTQNKPNHAEYVRKMIALEATSITERPRRPKTAAQFWEAIMTEAGPQISELEAIESEENRPKPYQQASKDLGEVKELVANPLIMALRQSVITLQQKS